MHTINYYSIRIGLLRLQQIYQGLRPGNESFHVETVKRITNVSDAIKFLRTLEELNRWSNKHIVLDCPTEIAKDIVVTHVRDITLGRRNYHYLLSGLVGSKLSSVMRIGLILVGITIGFSFGHNAKTNIKNHQIFKQHKNSLIFLFNFILLLYIASHDVLCAPIYIYIYI